MKRRGWFLMALLGLSCPPAWAADKPLSGPEKDAEAAIRTMLNKSAKAIDACTARYLREQPEARGQVRVDVMVKPDGSASDPSVQTTLRQARTLRLCLEAVAQQWAFPTPRGEGAPVGVTLQVAPNVKFRIPAPGEKPKEKASSKKAEKREGFINLSPGRFLPVFRGPEAAN